MIITREDIQRVGDEDTLLHFLEEKLNLSIPEEATLAQIALPLPLPFLGLDESISEQIIDCQDFSGLPKDDFGTRRPFLIRFRRAHDYIEILRLIATSLSQTHINPGALFLICSDEYFQPFALAYFKDLESEDWQAAELSILTWTQDNTYIDTSYEHEISDAFLGNKYLEDFDNKPPDTSEDIGSERFSQAFRSTIDQVDDLSNKPANYKTEPISPKVLLTKVKKIGTPLGENWNIHYGIDTGYSKAYIIDTPKYQELITADPNSKDLIKPYVLKPKKKWKLESKNMIWIPSGEKNKRPWSKAESEEAAEQIFEDAYPAIKVHLNEYKDKLQRRRSTTQGKFYWEIALREHYVELYQPKIVYPFDPQYMKACYDTSGALHLHNSLFIQSRQPHGVGWSNWVQLSDSLFAPVEDLFLLGILNSKLFAWYTREEYWDESYNHLNLRKKNMNKAPIAPWTEEQKSNISYLVKTILSVYETLDLEEEVFDEESPEDDEDMVETALSKALRTATQAPFEPEMVATSDMPKEDLDREILDEAYEAECEIDQLVYELYELTDAEIALIEEETKK